MKSIFEFKNYRTYLVYAFETRSKNGFGETKKLAEFLSIHPTFISQVLKDIKSLSIEQALTTTQYLNLNSLEAEYFLLLVQFDRAGTRDLKKHFEAKLREIQQRANLVTNRVDREVKLTSEQQATFYSDWVYSACRLATLLPGRNSAEALSEYLGITPIQLKRVTDFLVQNGMLKLENGKFEIGPLTTHLDADSPWIKSHHTNWRQKALERLSDSSSEALHYSAVSTLSHEDMAKIKEILLQSLKSVDEVIKPSPSETLVCLNIDWFEVKPNQS